MLELQKRIAAETHNCMRISHETYRSFYSDKRLEKCSGFVDGDLIESIIYMPKDTIQKIIQDLYVPKFMQIENVKECKFFESLYRGLIGKKRYQGKKFFLILFFLTHLRVFKSPKTNMIFILRGNA